MGCTSSNQTGTTKENTNSPPATITDDGQQLINDQFRTWLKSNRPKADEYVLNDVLSTAQPSNEAEDYKTIVCKALDLLAEHRDIKSTNKLGKLVQKEISLASPRKVAHTIDVLKQTADKLRNGNIQLDVEEQSKTITAPIATADQETIDEIVKPEIQQTPIVSGEPGIALKEALEKARILFYKGKQAAIFANPNGGYDVRILEDNDESVNHDGNLLRSIIVTEVRMRPTPTSTSAPLFNPPSPPTLASSKLLDENEVSDDFRRSIDAALKGLEVVYQASATATTTTTTTLPSVSEHVQEIHVDKPPKRPQSPPAPLNVQYGVTNVPLPRSTSKEKTKLSKEQVETIDRTVNLAEIIRQMAEQQRIVSEQLSEQHNEEKDQEINQPDIRPELVELVDTMNELIMDAIDVTTCSEIGNPISLSEDEKIEKVVNMIPNTESEGQIERIVKEIKEHGEKFESKEDLPPLVSTTKQPSSYSLGLTSPLTNETKMTTSLSATSTQQKPKLRSENRPKSFIANDEVPPKDIYNLNKQTSLDELLHYTQTGLSNPTLVKSITKLGVSTSSGKIEEEQQNQQEPIVTAEPLSKMPTSISQIIEEHRTIIDEPSSTAFPPPPVVTPVETLIRAKSPTHNVTYTEIIHSESRDGEQSRHIISESTDHNTSHDDEQTTTLKVITKSEFSNNPASGEKIMEQSVQVITVKVRNETITTKIQQTTIPSTTDNDIAYERRPVSELVKNFEVVAAANGNGVNS